MNTNPKTKSARPSAPGLRYIFFGTPEFSAHILQRLIEAGMTPDAIVCAPDRPVGRKQIIAPPPAKVIAETHDIPVLQPENVRAADLESALRSYKPDLLVVVAYGKILPKNILGIAPKGAINVHPSLLPRWRGPAPIQYALLSGDTETGVSIMLLDEEMDHGPLLAAENFPIDPRDTAATLHNRLAEQGAKLLIATLRQINSGSTKPKPQDHAQATFSRIIKKTDGEIDWSDRAEDIERKIRAFTPWPGAYTWLEEDGKVSRLRIIEAHCETGVAGPPGTVIKLENKKIAVRCGADGASLLVLDIVQPENKSPMEGYAFSLGHPEIFMSPLRLRLK